ncbi:hypothetical protein KC19_9G174100 [Ceratodon purpureus]|uniref:Uncharacterized protein n=1 Tax=Ceratodon purpureus TaxID=3225 RepID=A0A8T0GXJ1_CERPU|nr:hypothetical protein KC19_9G174100 [Ceratodon purpureus]
MSSAKELREARRRKILERGGDRLAYITGQVKTLPPAEPQVVSPPGESGLKSLSIAGELRSSSEGVLPTSSPSCDVNDISTKLADVSDELQSLNSAPEETTPLLPPLLAPAPALSTSQQLEVTTSSASLRVPTSSKRRSSFNYAALVKSIDHSLAVRALLAFFIGVSLVTQWTFSKCGRSWAFGSQNYILSWPVFLIVITDVTVVVGALLLGLVKVSPVPGKEKSSDSGGLAVFRDSRVEQMLAFTSQLEGALDFGLLVTKASRGLISDISLYLVTVICAMSIAQHYQPALCTYISR